MPPKILSEKPITLEEVRDFLRTRGEAADLNYIQRITFDYTHNYSMHFPNSIEFLEMLGREFNLTREIGIQLININPKTSDDLSLVLEDKLTSEEKETLLSLFEEHRAKYGSLIEENIPDDISTTSFDFKDDGYPDEEPTSE